MKPNICYEMGGRFLNFFADPMKNQKRGGTACAANQDSVEIIIQ